MKRIILGTLVILVIAVIGVLVVVSRLLAPSGGGNHAPRLDAPTFALRGSFPVGTRDFTIDDSSGSQRPLPATIWYPAVNTNGVEELATYSEGILSAEGQALRDAAPDTKRSPYPLVVFSHGSGGLRLQSLFLMEHLASYGFVVIAVSHTGNTLVDRKDDSTTTGYADRPNDLLRVISYADSLVKKDGPFNGAFSSVIDMQRIAVMGHSFGGFTALAVGGARISFDNLISWCNSNPDPALKPEDQCFLTNKADIVAKRRQLDSAPTGLWPATSDPRIKAVVALAPWNEPIFGKDGLASLTLPTMVIVGSKDRTTIPERDAYKIYDELGSKSKTLVTLDNAGHFIYVEACIPLAIKLNLFSSCSDKVWDMQRAHDLIKQFTTAFLLATLDGNQDAAKSLDPATVDFTGVQYKTTGLP